VSQAYGRAEGNYKQSLSREDRLALACVEGELGLRAVKLPSTLESWACAPFLVGRDYWGLNSGASHL
jgi:hypothetical protein